MFLQPATSMVNGPMDPGFCTGICIRFLWFRSFSYLRCQTRWQRFDHALANTTKCIDAVSHKKKQQIRHTVRLQTIHWDLQHWSFVRRYRNRVFCIYIMSFSVCHQAIIYKCTIWLICGCFPAIYHIILTGNLSQILIKYYMNPYAPGSGYRMTKT